MDNAEKLEYRLQLLCGYKTQFYANNLKYRVTAIISKTMSKIIDKKAMVWSEAQLLNEIERNGYPDINPFSGKLCTDIYLVLHAGIRIV